MKQKLFYFDLCRAIAIILVALAHFNTNVINYQILKVTIPNFLPIKLGKNFTFALLVYLYFSFYQEHYNVFVFK